MKYKNKCNNLRRQLGGSDSYDLNKLKLDQIHFWMHQFEEHITMIVLGIETNPDPTKSAPYVDNAHELKSEGIKLRTTIKGFMDKIFNSKGIDKNKIVLDESDYKKLAKDSFDDITISEADKLTRQIRDYKQKILDTIKFAQQNKRWLGWLFQSFVQHMVDELDNYEKIIKTGSDIQNGHNIEEQISFWTKINAEHVGLASHLLDIDYANDADFRNAYENYVKAQHFIGPNRDRPVKLTDELQAYLITLDGITHETRNKLESGQLKSIIHPDLAFHDVREAERAKVALQNLAQKQQVNVL
jgi:hypothetical protein